MLSKRVAPLLVLAGVLGSCAEQPVGPYGPGAPPGTVYGRMESGWLVLLENASSLENWNRVGNTHWREAEGAIEAVRGSGHLVTKDRYADFVLRAEFWVDDNADSGILIRCANPGNVGPESCYEINIHDKSPDPSLGTGAIVGVARVSPMPRVAGKWNTCEITARGAQLTVVLNGVRTVSVLDSRLRSGPIALQHAAGVVKFRRVQLRPL
jgi:hypothetical protein